MTDAIRSLLTPVKSGFTVVTVNFSQGKQKLFEIAGSSSYQARDNRVKILKIVLTNPKEMGFSSRERGELEISKLKIAGFYCINNE